ncbi:MAG TPA: hypothetical protein PKA64_07395 [Myxococcota bacterium]|nr:hypothetical protein [Myxococcota bacterium]
MSLILLALLSTSANAGGLVCDKAVSINARYGTLDYPAGDASYDNDLRACWTFAPALKAGERLRLRATRVDVEEGFDHLSIYGRGGRSLIDADVDTDAVYVDAEALTLRLESDPSVVGQGFVVSWEVVTPGGGGVGSPVVLLLEPEDNVRLPSDTAQAILPATERRGAALRSCGFEASPEVGFPGEEAARAELAWMEEVCAKVLDGRSER